MKNLEEYAKPLLRIGMSLIFLYFGFNQMTSPDIWAGFVPNFALYLGLTAKNIVMINSIFELVFGLLLLVGLFTRIVSLMLALHLFTISLSLGFNSLGVRDFGLAIGNLTVFLGGRDKYCLDNKLFSKSYKQ